MIVIAVVDVGMITILIVHWPIIITFMDILTHMVPKDNCIIIIISGDQRIDCRLHSEQINSRMIFGRFDGQQTPWIYRRIVGIHTLLSKDNKNFD